MSKGITSIEVTPSWGQSPARTRRSTGEVFINEDYLPAGWKYLPAIMLEKMLWKHPKWKFILRHEEGHIALNTSSEDLADDYASRKYFADGGSHRASVKALSEVLPMNTPQHHTRLMNQVQRALKDDCVRNKHQKSCMLLETIAGTTIGTLTAKAIDGGINAARERILIGGDNFGGSSLNEPQNHSVGINNGVSVLGEFENFSNADCGKRPVANPCKYKFFQFIAKRQCEDTNRKNLDAWNECMKTNQEGTLLDKQITTEKDKAALLAQNALEIQRQQAAMDRAADEEETKRQGQNKTPIVIIVAVMVAGIAVVLYFLFKTPAPTA